MLFPAPPPPAHARNFINRMRLNCTETPTHEIGTFGTRVLSSSFRPNWRTNLLPLTSPLLFLSLPFSLFPLFPSQGNPRLGKFDFKDLLATDTNTRLSRHSASMSRDGALIQLLYKSYCNTSSTADTSIRNTHPKTRSHLRIIFSYFYHCWNKVLPTAFYVNISWSDLKCRIFENTYSFGKYYSMIFIAWHNYESWKSKKKITANL